jgi:hypothetical protein
MTCRARNWSLTVWSTDCQPSNNGRDKDPSIFALPFFTLLLYHQSISIEIYARPLKSAARTETPTIGLHLNSMLHKRLASAAGTNKPHIFELPNSGNEPNVEKVLAEYRYN